MPEKGFFFGTTTEGESIIGEAIVEPSGKIDVEGEYKNHPKYGKQFVVSHIYYRDIKDLVAVLLSSGFLLGIREHKARDMARRLGGRCFEVLDACLQDPPLMMLWDGMNVSAAKILLSVNGIGPVVYDQIVTSWKERKAMASVSLMAIRVDLKPAQFRKAFAYYGDHLAHVILENAYALTNVPGITWETADRVALMTWEGKKAVDRNSVDRLGAGIREVLRQKKQMGHMAFPVVEVFAEAQEFLQPISVHLWDAVSPYFDKLGLVYFEEAKLIAFKEAYDVEVGTAKKIVELMRAPLCFPQQPQMNPQSFAERITLGPEHIEAIKMCLENNVSIVTGGPGTGKTTSVLNTLLNILDHYRISYALCAPTGKATIRMTEATGRPAYTLHKKFVLYEDDDVMMDEKYLIVDEMSMTDADVFYRVLRNVAKGKAIVLIGDGDQLPPVGPGEPLKQLLVTAGVPHIKMDKIYRQGAGSGIVKAAHMINKGEVPNTMDNFIYASATTDEGVRILVDHYIEDMMKNGIKFQDIQVLTPVNKGFLGRAILNQYLQNRYNPHPSDWKSGEYMQDDRVIHCKNNYKLEVMNGEVGEVSAINNPAAPAEGDLWAPMNANAWKVEVDYPLRGKVRYDDQALAELQLAYAMTIHKTQGSEFRAAIVVFPHTSPFFYLRPLPYTGITRAKDLCVVLSVNNAFMQYVKGRTQTKRYSMLAILFETLSKN
jgi:exodeoxyribonuclease V alpha subunit